MLSRREGGHLQPPLSRYIVQCMERLSLANPFGIEQIWFAETLDSTMNQARDMLSDGGDGQGLVVSAGFQRAGRGRGAGRLWYSKPGESLMVTIAVSAGKASAPLRIPLLAGVGVAEYLEKQWGLAAQLKWPNDILIEERKVCGILCETCRSHILIGIGLNLLERNFPDELKRRKFPPTSVWLEKGDRESLPEFSSRHAAGYLEGLLTALHESLYCGNGTDRLNTRLYARGDTVTFSHGAADAGQLVTGCLNGVDKDGALLIDNIPYYAGELV